MKLQSPHNGGLGGDSRQGRPELSTLDGLQAYDGDLCWSTRGRCQAVLAELEVQPVDWDVIATLLAGAVEEIEAAAP
jgi:hypothetical protein